MAELDILKETMENMITSTETKFMDVIDSHKTHLYDIEHDVDITQEERNSLSNPYIIELEDYITQRIISRNKLIICIYSICEATLDGICKVHDYNIIKEPYPENQTKKCPHLNNPSCDVKDNKSTNYYLNDFLYTLEPNYKTDWENAVIVSTAIKPLRNYLTHGKRDVKEAKKIIVKLCKNKINGITQVDGVINIGKVEDICYILKLCYDMLVDAERIAVLKSNSNILANYHKN